MKKLMTQLASIFKSTQGILQKIFSKVTEGTGVVFKTAGATLATVLATIVAACIFCMLIIVSIPVGIVNGSSVNKEAKCKA